MAVAAENKGTMDMFLTRALERVQQDAYRKAPLRDACTDTLELVKRMGIKATAAGDASSAEMDMLVNKLINTLQLACESKVAKIMTTALDCLQKLMAYGFIRGDLPDHDAPNKTLMDKVINIISRCFDFPDETVRLQIIKAFLTAVSSPVCDVHEHALMNAIRTCYNIYLVSKSPVNQTTAKATLTQMLSIIFQRMETAPVLPVATSSSSPASSSSSSSSSSSAANPATPQLNAVRVVDSPRPAESPRVAESPRTDATGAHDATNGVESTTTVKHVQEAFTSSESETSLARAPSESSVNGTDEDATAPGATDDATAQQPTLVVTDADTPRDSADTPRDSTDTPRDSAETPREDGSSETTSAPGEVTTVRNDGSEPRSSHDESRSSLDVPNGSSSSSANAAKAPTDHAYADCYLIFRALCKLSLKEVPASATNTDSPDMRNRIFSLELLYLIIENAGPVLRSHDRFVNQAIKKYLCMSLLSNGVSPVQQVFKLSLDIFYALILNFKDHLKNEIGVFFTKIFLPILASANSTANQKLLVLQVLLKICKLPQTLVGIFVNYDCDIGSSNIFERMVNELAGIAKHAPPQEASFDVWSGPTVDSKETEIQLVALECLVTIMKSLVDWSRELRDEDASEKDESESEDHGDAVDQLVQQKQYKQQLEEGKKLFNIKPRKGINYLVSAGHFERTPQGVAKFLLAFDGLDKVKIGEFLGDPDPFNIEVLYAYVDSFNFAEMEVDTALREFLGGFRLPGEAQKIDRMMEKFAERYYHNNPKDIFENADAVYVFAFHMIMLATDLHSPAIKRRITKAEWIKNNKGLNDGKDFPEKFLIQIFERIAKNEIRTKDSDETTTTTAPELLNPKQRQILFHKEGRMMVKKSQELILAQLQNKSTFVNSKNIEYVKPMFERCWCPMLAAFSQILENSEDPKAISLCLQGFKCAVHVSAVFFMETERNAFVTSLFQFTLLSNTREMKPKNIGCIKALIEIAHEDGNYLQDSWIQVLTCISQLEKMHLIGSGAKTTGQMVDTHTRRNSIPSTPGEPKRVESTSQAKVFEGVNASSVVGQIKVEEIDKIFADTILLNSNAIVEFVRCLCDVSSTEVDSAEPRIFSLQKLVEVAHFNMERIRFVWSQIWGVMADHFKKVGVHKNHNVAMYAVDSLRQLSMKFLEKSELANYHFQKDFLKPFEYIMLHSGLKIRELVVRCLSQMILARAVNIRSGWKSMFVVFSSAAADTDESIVSLSFEIVDKIMLEYFSLIADSFFIECVKCLDAYARSNHIKDISILAVRALGYCAEQLAAGKVFPLKPDADGIAFKDEELHLKHWFPILTALAHVVSHKHIDVRTAALEQLFNSLQQLGPLFSDKLWEMIFHGALLPLFDTVRYAGDDIKEDNEWLTTTCLSALTRLIDLFSFFFDRLRFLSDEYLVLLASCTLQENESLARIGATCLLQFVVANAGRWDSGKWWTICATFLHVLENNTCSELLAIAKSAALKSAQNAAAAAASSPASAGTGGAPPTTTTAPPLEGTGADQPNYASAAEGPSENGTDSHESHASDSATAAAAGEGAGASEADATEASAAPSEPESFEIQFTNKLKHSLPPRRRPLDKKVINGRCNVQLVLIQSIQEITLAHYQSLEPRHLDIMLTALLSVFKFSFEANTNKEIWRGTAKTGLMPLLVKQEHNCMASYLNLLLRMYSDSEPERVALAEARLIPCCQEILQDFIHCDADAANIPQQYLAAKVPIVQATLRGMLQWKEAQFRKHLSLYYSLFASLILVTNPKIREVLKETFERIGALHGNFATAE